MNAINWIKKNYWALSLILMLFIFLGTCNANKNAKKALKKAEQVESVVVTKKQMRDEMEEVMLDFLIYEDELDKKKITISQIKERITENDEE